MSWFSQLFGGQLLGSGTNDNANAGNVGEFVSSTVLVGSAVALTTGVTANITSISLTAGDWDVWGNVLTNPAATTTTSNIVGSISTTSATLPTAPNGGAYAQLNTSIAANLPQALPTGTTRLSLSATTTVFLVTQVAFATSTMGAYGFIGARRRR